MGNTSSKIIAMVGLIAGVVGLSLGFAAFSNTLTIKSSAEVTPDQSTFDVNLYSNEDGTSTTGVAVTNASNLAVGTATITNPTATAGQAGTASIEGLKATFTEPGQSVTYTFYAKNDGQYNAFLKNVTYNKVTGENANKVCTPKTGTTESLVTAACEHIHLTVKVGDDATVVPTAGFGEVTLSNHSLLKGNHEKIEVTISYDAETESTGIIRADGDFDVAFGDVDLLYASV